MKAIQNTAFGDPAETLKLVDVPEPASPGPNEILLGMDFAPINPNDLYLASGQFAFRLDLPSGAGNEGVGRVLAVGSNVREIKAGDRVAPPLLSLTWRERVLVPAKGLFALPTDADPKQLSMLRINPPTAALVLSEYSKLNPGEWVVQNAANSGVGRSLIAVAKARGLKTINLVRRESVFEELKRCGGDVVMLDNDEAPAKVKAIVGEFGLRLAIDGITGASMGRLGSMLAPDSNLVVYGPMAEAPSTGVSIFDLLFKNISVHGFFMTRPKYAKLIDEAMRECAPLIASGMLHFPIAATYPMSAIKEAVTHAKKGGKVLLDLQAK